MENHFARQAAKYRNEMVQSCSELLGLAEGLIADKALNDQEIRFLDRWLHKHAAAASGWPGDVIAQKVREVLQDGIITDDERTHLLDTLLKLSGGHLDQLGELPRVNELALDAVEVITFPGFSFCLTGDFVYAPRQRCEREIAERGGLLSKSVTKTLNYLVVGGLGSEEWKHGSYGTKIDRAIEYKRLGLPILIVHEDIWAHSL